MLCIAPPPIWECCLVLVQVPPCASIPVLDAGDAVQERKVKAKVGRKCVVIEEHCIVQGFFQWLYVLSVKVVTEVVPEAPHECNIGVFVFEIVEVLTAYPPVLVGELAANGIGKQLRTHPVNVVYVILLVHI